MNSTADIVIIGGGVIGSAIAYFLAANPDFGGKIAVLEKDPGFAYGSTGRSAGGVRQQFSTAENIRMSQYAVEFLDHITDHLSVDGTKVEVDFRQNGYLFLASDEGLGTIYANNQVQQSEGVAVALLDPDDLVRRFPWMNAADLAGGSLGLGGEGWLDPWGLHQAFRKKARSLNVRYLDLEAVGFWRKDGRIETVRLDDNTEISADIFINAAGVEASRVADWADIDLSVRPRKRFVYSFSCRRKLEGCPLVIDPSGVYFRPEGDKFITGCSPLPGNDPDCLDFEIDYDWFEEHIWPALAIRVPAFEAIKLEHAWAGHYAYNLLDQNALLGRHPGCDNLYFANGFSGHGLQQSPAVGRGISELILYGAYQTLNLDRFSVERLLTNKRVTERNIV